MRIKYSLSCGDGTKAHDAGSNLAMLDLRSERIYFSNPWLGLAAVVLILTPPLVIGAQQAPASDSSGAATEIVSVASPGALARLLPDNLSGIKATCDIRSVSGDNIADLVADKAAIYHEYLVTSAVSRDYAGVGVDVFETRNPFAAFGLFTFSSGATEAKPIDIELGSGGARLGGELIFWKGSFFVRVRNADQKDGRGRTVVPESIARAVADEIGGAGAAATRPPLLDSLPETVNGAMLLRKSERYFLGPESLKAFVEHAGEMFQFVGDTEAVIGEYAKADSVNIVTSRGRASDQISVSDGSAGHSAAVPAAQPLKLVIVECHTPEFASDELARITSYVSSLPEVEQQQIVFKRTGNYIVAAVNVQDREFGEGLINSVQYRYTVKWLRNPLWPTNDPFRSQKAAEMLLSTFGLLGLILMTVLIVGTVFGTTVFLKRRKQQSEIFSDAGGMLRLDIEPFVLGLPPKRSEE